MNQLKALFFFVLSICSLHTAAQRIKGSDTVLPVSQETAEIFMNTHPEQRVTVTGGGTGVGISALMDHTTDIAMASRPIKFSEKMKLKAAGQEVKEVIIAYDALAIIVHPDNPVSRLTRQQLEGIFRGKIVNWKQVGGPDMKIIVYSRETSSGTYEFFKESVLKNKNYMSGSLSMPATGAVIQSVSQTKGAIGYVGLAYLSDRAAQVDDQEFHRVEDPRRGVFDADHQPAFVVQLHAARGVQPHGRVEAVVIAVAETFRAGRLGLRPGRVAANGAGSGDEQGFGVPAAERVGQLLPECARFARRIEIAQSGFQVVARHCGLGQQDELRAGGDLRHEVRDVALLPLGVAVEFVVTVHVGLDDAHSCRPLVGLLPALPDAQRRDHRQRDGAGCRRPPARAAAGLQRFENQYVGE